MNHKGFAGGDHDWRVVYTERYERKEEAYSRERKVKVWKQETLGTAGSEHPAL